MVNNGEVPETLLWWGGVMILQFGVFDFLI